MKKSHFLWALTIWTFILAGSFTWNYYVVESSNSKLVLNKARAFFKQILVTRAWNAEHKGVYVLINAENQPNEYLKDSLRDLVATNGMKLTKVNPAYMTRQIARLNTSTNDLQFHITSLNPIRPANKADGWETKTLSLFETGTPEFIELIDGDTASQYRYMAPLITEKSCLKCHAEQGYEYGDIRGGISVSFPATEYLESTSRQLIALAVVHFILYLLGVAGLWVYYRKANLYLQIIEKKNNDLVKINATKDKFFSIIGHDLKNPFTSIMGFSDLLNKQMNEKDYEGIDKYAKIIHESSGRLLNLLNNLLEWSRTQTGRIAVNPDYFDVSAVVNEVQELVSESAQKKSIAVGNCIPAGTRVFADKNMIETVVRNLVSNALKFTQSGGRISVSATSAAIGLTVCIADNGVGIPREKIGRLFDVAGNNPTAGTENEKGTGLGLIICKEFIEKNNGRIWVESEAGTGSSFYFTIPVSPA
jgi:signal transduction histidine kinase